MPVNYKWKPQTGQYVETPEEVQKFKAIHHRIKSMVSCVEKWMDDISGATGIVHLSESHKHCDMAFAILEELETNPSREMRRLTNAYNYFKSFFYAAKEGRLDSRLGFGSGVKAQQYLDALRRVRDEWKQIVEYADE